MKKKLIGIFVILIGLVLTSCDFFISEPARLLEKEIEEHSDCSMIVFYRMDDEYDNREKELKTLNNDIDCTLSEFVIEIKLNGSVCDVVPVYYKDNCVSMHWLCEKDGVLDGWSNNTLSDGYTIIIWKTEEGKARKTFREWWKSKYPSSEFTVYNFNYDD